MKKSLLFLLVCVACCGQLLAQCGSGQSTVIIQVRTDHYPLESNWQLTNASTGISYASVTAGSYTDTSRLYIDTVCVPTTSCVRFRMGDTYGDGVCCAFGHGYYLLIVDGDTLASGGHFTHEELTFFNCPPGTNCSNPDTAFAGNSYTAPNGDYWYRFVPDTTGLYEFSTCSTNTCDTRIWIYDHCSGIVVDTSNIGTVYFDDNSCGGLQATIGAAMAAGQTYYVRIGSTGGTACSGAIHWNLTFAGAIRGCMDSTACNFNPLATIPDTTCIYPGDPACPTGPDLDIREDIFINTLQLDVHNSTDACFVNENCIGGMGMRDLVRFSTHIENNGTQDYFIGVPSSSNPQFVYGSCHGHWHYQGYAEYILFDQNGTALPSSFKNGFCVLDLDCSNGGTAQYGCGNMGISVNCADEYYYGLDCQWVDVTNVPDGNYTLVIRVNWDGSPDALGRYEMSYANNWAQACITLSRATGTLTMTVNPNCPVYVDCMGIPFGNAQPDCMGICNGPNWRGDQNGNHAREGADADMYIQSILAGNASTECNDLFRDSTLTVFDAALLVQCINDSTTAHCTFPHGLVNILDTVGLRIMNVDFANQYVDIAIRNPLDEVLAYQFTMSGIVVDHVENLVDPAVCQITPHNNSDMVVALSQADSTINRQSTPHDLCRVYFSSITGNEICIDEIQSIVNRNYQEVISRIEGSCVLVTGVEEIAKTTATLQVQVAPNPFQHNTRFVFDNNTQPLRLEITDIMGKSILIVENIVENQYTFQRNNLPSGVYFYKISDGSHVRTGKLVTE